MRLQLIMKFLGFNMFRLPLDMSKFRLRNKKLVKQLKYLKKKYSKKDKP